MTTRRATAIARHVEAAQRLLAELEHQAELGTQALDRESGGVNGGELSELSATVATREAILGELDGVVASLAEARDAAPELADDPAIRQLLAEMGQTAARALASHERLARRAQEERDRLGSALRRIEQPDAVATRYGAMSGPPMRPRRFSVTG